MPTVLLPRAILAASLLLGNGATWAESRCSENTSSQPATLNCSYKTLAIDSGSAGKRKVVYQVPLGKAPAGGWPVALLYHGALVTVYNFSYHSDMPFGGYYQGKLIQGLLDGGYAVVAPNALTSKEAWQTNAPEYASDYQQSNDYLFLNNLFGAIASGKFGPLNRKRQYATGISSGGYNSSRMAVSFPGKFKALAIQSASYATCVGGDCAVPALPADHPPTLFIHGQLDWIVPWTSMQPYHERLLYLGLETSLHSEPDGGHAWFASSPGLVLDWFNRHP